MESSLASRHGVAPGSLSPSPSPSVSRAIASRVNRR